MNTSLTLEEVLKIIENKNSDITPKCPFKLEFIVNRWLVIREITKEDSYRFRKCDCGKEAEFILIELVAEVVRPLHRNWSWCGHCEGQIYNG